MTTEQRDEKRKKFHEQVEDANFTEYPAKTQKRRSSRFNPLGGNPKQRPYAKHNAVIQGEIKPIEEPTINTPVITFDETGSKIDSGIPNSDGGNPPVKKSRGKGKRNINTDGGSPLDDKYALQDDSPMNPDLERATNKEKKEAAKLLAEEIVNGWANAKKMLGNLLKWDDNKMRIKALKGKFDYGILSLPLPVGEDESQTVSVGQFLAEMNTAIDDAFEFKEENRAKAFHLLTKVLEKRGAGMTPEQALIMLGIQELIGVGTVFFSIRSATNTIIETAMAIKAENAKAQEMAEKARKDAEVARQVAEQLQKEREAAEARRNESKSNNSTSTGEYREPSEKKETLDTEAEVLK